MKLQITNFKLPIDGELIANNCGLGCGCRRLRSAAEQPRPLQRSLRANHAPVVVAIMLAALPTLSAKAQSLPADSQPTTSAQSTAALVPITFARGGGKVTAELMAVNFPYKEFVLRAFGRTLSSPAPLKDVRGAANWTAEFDVPAVRVPTVFAITPIEPVDAPQTVLGELVVYPDRDVEWEKKLTLYTCGAPAWFEQWIAAIGLPVKQVATAELATAKLAPDKEDGKSLLILGSATAGEDLADLIKQVRASAPGVLVLEAGWFGDSAGAVSVAPAQMLGGLSEISTQRWPQPLKFDSRRKPWPGIANRWAWIVDDQGLPLVEEIHASKWLGWREVSSYLPWANVLGRREQADELLLGILKSAASLEASSALADAGRFGPMAVSMLHPARKDVSPSDRPVLSALPWRVYSAFEPPCLFVLDLRGKVQSPSDILDRCRSIEGRHNPDGVRKLRVKATDLDPWRSLLILGDDKLLDDWEWLKFDRAKKRIGRPGVEWLPDDELPPSKDNQIRLMLKLTGLGVPLAPPEQQEEQK